METHKMNLISGRLTNRLMVAVMTWVLMVSMSGCVTALKGVKSSGDSETAPNGNDSIPVVRAAVEPVQSQGSLWQEDGPFNQLYVDQKARQVGDIVTIRIVESSSASNNAATETERDSNLLGQITSFLGIERRWNDPSYPGFDPDRLLNPFSSVEGNLKSDFTGSGKTTRSGNIKAIITARVTDVVPGGNIKIRGSREVEINNEKQILTLSGVIRTKDISPDNTVLSNYISDAQISYSGLGVVNDRQRPGWMANILNKIWPF
jgi:flagellar L-ring protein precursor FlgH